MGPTLKKLPMLLVAGLLPLAGCDLLVDGEAEAPGNVGQPIGPKGPKAADEKQMDPYDAAIANAEQYTYNPIGKRDPFRSFLAFDKQESAGPPPTPLQKYEIDRYGLVGIIWGIDRPRALVQDPDGVGHVMEIGTYIGKNWGKVTQITSGEVIVTEEYQTIDGELVVNNISMTLPVEGAGRVR